MLTAKEARVITSASNTADNDMAAILWFLDHVENCAKRGKDEFIYQGSVSQTTIHGLRFLGYKVLYIVSKPSGRRITYKLILSW